MAELKLKLPISCYNENQVTHVFDVFSNFSFEWQFDGYPRCLFNTEVIHDIDLCHRDDPKIIPMAVVFRTELDTDDESGLFEELDESYEWDDFHFEEALKLYMAITLAIVLSHPELNIACAAFHFYVNDQFLYRDLSIEYPIQNDSYKNHPTIFQSSVSLQAAFDWLTKKAHIFQSNAKPTISISALSYILNRDIREILIYSSIGLESLYVPEGHNERELLKQRIKLLFSNVDSQDTIHKMYKYRSKFVHGEYYMGVYPDTLFLHNESDDEVTSISEFSTAILIESIRMLIANDATRIKFSGENSFSFVK